MARQKFYSSYDDLILELIQIHGAMLGVNITLAVMNEVNPQLFDNNKFVTAIEKLTIQSKILRLICTTKDRSAVIYFPAGTTFYFGDAIRIHHKGELESLTV